MDSPRLENTIFPSSLKEEVELEARKQGFENRKYARRNRIGKLRYEVVVKIEKKIGRIRIEIKEKKNNSNNLDIFKIRVPKLVPQKSAVNAFQTRAKIISAKYFFLHESKKSNEQVRFCLLRL